MSNENPTTNKPIKLIGKIIAILSFVFIINYAAQWLFYIIYSIFKDPANISTAELGIYDAIVYITIALAIIFIPKLISKKFASTRKSLGLSGLPTFTDIGLIIAEFILFFVFSSILTKIFSTFSWFNASEAQNVGFSDLYTKLDKTIAFVSLCVVAPIAEEVIFRGWFYGKLRSLIPGKKSSIIFSILLTSLLFAILHGQWNVGITVFVLSVIMCIARELTGTIYSGILLHILKNAIAFLLVFATM